jgi:hypothetical protein
MEDKDYLAALRQAYDDGRLQVELDYGKLDHLDSPINVQAEKAWWIFGGLFGGIGLGYFFDWHYGVGFAAVIAALYVTLGKRIINRRMRARLRSMALEDIAVWRKLWRIRGVTLAVGEARCVAPDGNWVRFAMSQVTGETTAS